MQNSILDNSRKFFISAFLMLMSLNVHAGCNLANKPNFDVYFRKSIPNTKYGYDFMEPADYNDDHISVEQGMVTYVRITVDKDGDGTMDTLSASEMSKLTFTSSDDNFVRIVSPLPTSISSADGVEIQLEGVAVSPVGNPPSIKVTHADSVSSTELCGKITVHVYEDPVVPSCNIYYLYNEPNRITSADMLSYANNVCKQAVLSHTSYTIHNNTLASGWDVNVNGSLDVYFDGGEDLEVAALRAQLSGFPNCVVADSMKQCWRLSQNASAGDTNITMVGVNFIKTQSSFQIGGTGESVTVTSVSGDDLTLSQPLQNSYVAGDVIFRPGGGKASNPIVGGCLFHC